MATTDLITSSGILGFKGNFESLSFCRSFSYTSSGVGGLPFSVTWRTRCALGSTDAPAPPPPLSSSALAVRLRSPFGPFHSSSRETSSPDRSGKARRNPPRKRKAQLKKSVHKLSAAQRNAGTQSERWQFLKQIPNQLVRDIAYVVASPCTFSDSNELPLVSKEMFGEDDSWHIVADWLKGLDAKKVLQWFEARRYTTRLGDHFAACIEYVLKFSPLVLPNPLYISQQVVTCTIHNQQSLKTLKKSKGKFGCFDIRSGGVMSEVIIKQIENDVLVKRFSSYFYNSKGRIKEIPDSKVERTVAAFKNSPFDYHADKEMQVKPSLEEDQENGFREHHYGDPVRQNIMKLPEGKSLYLQTREAQKWRVQYSTDEKDKQVLEEYKVHSHGLHGKTSSAAPERLVFDPKKSGETAPHASFINRRAVSDRTVLNPKKFGEWTSEGKSTPRNVSSDHRSMVWKNPAKANKKPMLYSKVKPIGKVDPDRRPKHVEWEKGSTAGECDFLFKANASNLTRDLLDYAWTEVHHWEVSVHFLSYIGPWEVFGLVTPGSAVWHQSGKRVFAAIEGLNPDSVEMNMRMPYGTMESNTRPDQISVLDACYVAPSIGDTWLDRKKSMGSKLQFCRLPNTAAKVSNLFHSSLRHDLTLGNVSRESPREDSSMLELVERKPLRGPQGEDYSKYRDDPTIIRIIPRALTKGYLFYEPQLWLALCMQKAQGECPISVEHPKEGNDVGKVTKFSTSYLSPKHWMGWWVYACDFAEFALTYGCENSMWYIAPRNEWLSPVIIGKSERQRLTRVFDLVGVLTIISKVGEEAAALHPPRKRRFMVVEVCWDPDVCTTIVHPPSCKLKAERDQHAENPEGKGGWVEVSRGFVVEKTWPDSRECLAHGFTLSWSPTLLGWS